MHTEKLSIDHVSEEPNINPVMAERFRTREKVFTAIGNTVDLGADISEFALETTAYTTGRAILALKKGYRALKKGLIGGKFDQAA